MRYGYGSRWRLYLFKLDFAALAFLDVALLFACLFALAAWFEPDDGFPSIELPFVRSATYDADPDPQRLVLWVKKDGSIWFGGSQRTEEEVRDALAIEARLSRDVVYQRVILVKADRRVQFKHIRKIIGFCRDRKIRIWRLSFGVRP